MNNLTRKTLTIIAVIAISTSVASCSKPLQKEVLRPVRYAKVSNGIENLHKSFAGVIRSDNKSKLSFKVNGNIQNILVDIGDKVKKGQLIAKLDPQPYRIKVQELEAKIIQAQATAITAKSTYERYRTLYIDGAVSEKSLDDMRTEAHSAISVLKTIKKSIEYAKLELNYTNLFAPMNGYITEKYCEMGENAQQGQAVLGFITSANPEVEVNIPQSYITQIKKSMPVTVKVDFLKGKTLKGKVKEIGMDSQLQSVTYPVIISLQDNSKDIRSGMSASVIFKFAKGQDAAVVVPVTSVAKDQKGNYVYVLSPFEKNIAKVKRVDVEVGSIKNNGLEIKKGLLGGEVIVTAGVIRIQDGQKVKYTGSFGE